MPETQWTAGDRVRHPKKPEWGHGVVKSALTTTQDGRPCQRVEIRFDRAGLKTISTAFVGLAAVGEPTAGASDDPAPDPVQGLMTLPEEATDPFAPPEARLRASLELYRFEDSGASLIAWATVRSGLADPLAEFSRHELEEHFRRFRTTLGQHVRTLIAEIRRKAPGALDAIAREAPRQARDVLRRHNVLR